MSEPATTDDAPGMPAPSGREMCEKIAEYWRKIELRDVTPEAIWNYSPTGELSSVFLWYRQAMAWERWEEARDEYHESRLRAMEACRWTIEGLPGGGSLDEIKATLDELGATLGGIDERYEREMTEITEALKS